MLCQYNDNLKAGIQKTSEAYEAEEREREEKVGGTVRHYI
jgi:hypothetical protein